VHRLPGPWWVLERYARSEAWALPISTHIFRVAGKQGPEKVRPHLWEATVASGKQQARRQPNSGAGEPKSGGGRCCFTPSSRSRTDIRGHALGGNGV